MDYEPIPLPNTDLEPVATVAQGIAAARSMREVFRALTQFAARTSPATGIFVVLYLPDTSMRRCVYSADIVVDAAGDLILEENVDLSKFPDLPLNQGPQSQAILTGEVVNTPDLAAAVVGLPRVDTGSDFDEKPPRSSLAVPFGLDGHVLGAIEVQSPRLAAFRDEHTPGLRMTATLAAIAVRNLDLLERERAQHEATLRALGVALEYRDYETKGHTDRVVALAVAFGERLGMDEPTLQALRWGAYLHDLGKVAIPDGILLKPDRLTDDEFEHIRRHTVIGIEMCRDIPFLSPGTREVVRSHHERWDGDGYPDRLAGSEIPLLARMFSLVDVYDALTSERPYKGAWTHDEAVAELVAQAGEQFDPELIGSFVDVVVALRTPTPAGEAKSRTD